MCWCVLFEIAGAPFSLLLIQNTCTLDNLFLYLCDEQLQVKIVDMAAAETLYPLKVIPKVFERIRSPGIELNLSQLIEGGKCMLRAIHRNTLSIAKIISRRARLLRYGAHN